MLKDRTALITGADRGLGRYTAEVFIRNRAKVVICSRNMDRLKEAALQIGSDNIICVQADISSKDEVDRLFDKIIAELGHLDILVNNAGIQGPIGRFEDIDWEKWLQVFDINLFGTAYCMRKAIELFKKQGSKGKIINISGGGATSSRPNFSGYAASKCAVVRLTEILADENREYNIDINAVAPGIMNTDMLSEIVSSGEAQAGRGEYRKAVDVIGSDNHSLDKPAELITYLASDSSDGISGKIISAVWDEWNEENFRQNSENRDMYTLRRITE